MNVETWSYWFRRYQALRLTWTHEKPTVPGWYWWRGDVRDYAWLVSVHPRNDSSEMCAFFIRVENFLTCQHPHIEKAETIAGIDGEWAGPIPEPEGE
jgi:hypothetical protein